MINFVSRIYSESISDVQFTKVCAILSKLEPGHAVMAGLLKNKTALAPF